MRSPSSSRSRGADYETVRDALLRHENQEVADWARDSGPLMLRRIYDSASPARPLRLDEFVADMASQKYIYKPLLRPLARRQRRRARPALRGGGRGRHPILNAAGEPLLQNPSAWLASHAPVEQIVWAPGEPRDHQRQAAGGERLERPARSGRIQSLQAASSSSARAPTPTKAGPWLDHVRKIYPDDAGHIIRFNAHSVQFPHVKINHGIVLGGSPGIGKDTLLAPIRFAVGPSNFAEISPQQVMGNFNGFIRSVIVRISEAKDMGEVDRFKFYEHMKDLSRRPARNAAGK